MQHDKMYRIFKLFLVLSVLCTLSVCGPPTWEKTKRKGARVIIDAVDVNWSVVRSLAKGKEGELNARFTFTRTFKGKIMPAHLTLDQRVDYAQRAVLAHPGCTWAGFDTDINWAKARIFGAAKDVIIAQVRC